MNVFKTRSRMISVRLSEEEYTALLGLCATTGARSVSDLTRDAVRALLNSEKGSEVLSREINDMKEQFKALEHQIQQISGRITVSSSHGE